MFGMQIGIRLDNWGWKLGLEIWDKDGMVMRMGTGDRLGLCLGLVVGDIDWD